MLKLAHKGGVYIKNNNKKKQKTNYKVTINNLKRSWACAHGQKTNLILFCLSNLITCGFGIISPILAAKIITNLTKEFYQQLVITACVVFLLDIIWIFLGFLSNVFVRKIYLGTLTVMQFKLAEEILKLETKELDNS